MPVSRASAWFDEALSSVLAQDAPDLEVVVTDDSGGGLESAVRRRCDHRIRYSANTERLGFAGNHARALDMARGDLIAFLHDDDQWLPGYLPSAVAILEEHPTVGMVITDAVAVDADGGLLGLRPPGMSPGLQADPLRYFLKRDFGACIPSATVFRRNALEANRRPWPDVVVGDLTMFVDAASDGWHAYRVQHPLVRYRVHSSQISQDVIAMHSGVLSVMGRYRFPDRRSERRRVRRMASELVSRAAAHLRSGDAIQARQDLRASRLLARTERVVWSSTIWLFSYLGEAGFVALDRWLRGVRDGCRRVMRTIRSLLRGPPAGVLSKITDGRGSSAPPPPGA